MAATSPPISPASPPPATAPTLPEFIGAYGMERGTQLHSEMTDKLSQNQKGKKGARLSYRGFRGQLN